jgi:hypothetical protein
VLSPPTKKKSTTIPIKIPRKDPIIARKKKTKTQIIAKTRNSVENATPWMKYLKSFDPNGS